MGMVSCWRVLVAEDSAWPRCNPASAVDGVESWPCYRCLSHRQFLVTILAVALAYWIKGNQDICRGRLVIDADSRFLSIYQLSRHC